MQSLNRNAGSFPTNRRQSLGILPRKPQEFWDVPGESQIVSRNRPKKLPRKAEPFLGARRMMLGIAPRNVLGTLGRFLGVTASCQELPQETLGSFLGRFLGPLQETLEFQESPRNQPRKHFPRISWVIPGPFLELTKKSSSVPLEAPAFL